jgi:hypothetical protein
MLNSYVSSTSCQWILKITCIFYTNSLLNCISLTLLTIPQEPKLALDFSPNRSITPLLPLNISSFQIKSCARGRHDDYILYSGATVSITTSLQNHRAEGARQQRPSQVTAELRVLSLGPA